MLGVGPLLYKVSVLRLKSKGKLALFQGSGFGLGFRV